jgi:phenylalanyl-tRNA synthetase beta chain
MNAIWAAPTGGNLRDALLFDIYRPKTSDAGRMLEKSMAVRLTLNAQDVALTEEQIESAVASVVATLAAQVGARQRV